MPQVRILLLLALVALASAVQPRQDSGFIQEQLLQQHQQEQSHWELGTYRRTGLSASETMSCPIKPQGEVQLQRTAYAHRPAKGCGGVCKQLLLYWACSASRPSCDIYTLIE
jgi:hypothetical protein